MHGGSRLASKTLSFSFVLRTDYVSALCSMLHTHMLCASVGWGVSCASVEHWNAITCFLRRNFARLSCHLACWGDCSRLRSFAVHFPNVPWWHGMWITSIGAFGPSVRRCKASGRGRPWPCWRVGMHVPAWAWCSCSPWPRCGWLRPSSCSPSKRKGSRRCCSRTWPIRSSCCTCPCTHSSDDGEAA